jgi:hypothetical protein
MIGTCGLCISVMTLIRLRPDTLWMTGGQKVVRKVVQLLHGILALLFDDATAPTS